MDNSSALSANSQLCLTQDWYIESWPNIVSTALPPFIVLSHLFELIHNNMADL